MSYLIAFQDDFEWLFLQQKTIVNVIKVIKSVINEFD